MKIMAAKADEFCRGPDAQIRAILVYGSNEGLVRERATTAAHSVAQDLDDPFRVSEFEASALSDDPARLADEAAALALSGGRRVVKVRRATDSHSKLFEVFLSAAVGEALVVVEAGGLGPRSPLRKLFETAKNGAAVPCYDEDSQSSERLLQAFLEDRNREIEPEAAAYLVERLGKDRMQIVKELEKLMLYAGPKPPGAGDPAPPITLDDVYDSIGDASVLSLDELCMAVGSGNSAALDRALTRAALEGVQPVQALRTVIRHFQRLQLVVGLIARGESADQAMRAPRPPVFARGQAAFRDQAKRWPLDRLGAALQLLTEAELECKTTGLPAQALCSRALMRVAGAARAERAHGGPSAA
jgi:DNA polymerase-3 subunit delta